MNAAVQQSLRALAATPVLLVASDFDGTIAPIVARPDLVKADERAWAALKALAALPHTHGAVITGRARADAATHLPGIHEAGLTLIGSHGVEYGPGEVRLDAAATDAYRSIEDLLHAESIELPGSLVETKPASLTFHVRMAAAEAGEAALARLKKYAQGMRGVAIVEGDKVIELSVLEPGKGRALNRLRYSTGATGVLFIGDDTTDESAFAELKSWDAAIKIGPGPTAAPLRIDDQAEVAAVFEELLALRRHWLAHRDLVPIERHSMLSDQRSLALVDDRGSVVWACLPRIDAPPIFASLVGERTGPTGGHGDFTIEPGSWEPRADPPPGLRPNQQYDGDSFLLRTVWPPADGAGRGLTVTDYLDCSGGRPFQRAGRSELIRIIEGGGRARIRFAPRLDFGRVATGLRVHPGGLEVDGWPEPIVLRCDGLDWRIVPEGNHQTALADVDLDARGKPVILELRYGTASFRDGPINHAARTEQSRRFWASWAEGLVVPSLHERLVRRSALAIKGLTFGPSGAISAAGTTSLPEHLGGVRNWDYRYCWVRDACMAASALARLGNTGAGLRMLDWLLEVVEGLDAPERLRPLYTVAGHSLGAEAEISELAGYGGSRPVRVSNAAAHQVQLDVFGPIVELVALLTEAGAPVTPEMWRLVEAMVEAVRLRWKEPDHGIWEIRGPKRHHVHTKAMCWLAVDRALYVAEHAMGMRRGAWEGLRRDIVADVEANGIHPTCGCFTAAYGDTGTDASTLLIGLCGMIDPRDARYIATVHAVERDLKEGPVVARYRVDDGLPGHEGAWLICATWLAEAYALIGRMDEARALVSQVAALAGPTGLMAEEYDSAYRIALGNFPQAYSHLGLINACLRLESVAGPGSAARERDGTHPS